MKYIVILILLFFSTPANAGFHIGISSILLGSDDITLSPSVGYSKFFKNNLVFDLTTNALYPTESKFNKRGFLVKSKATHIAGSVGYKLDRTVLSVFTTLVKIDNRIYYHNVNIDNYDNKAVVFGGNVSYFFKGVAVSTFILLPKPNIDLKLSGGVGLNYYF